MKILFIITGIGLGHAVRDELIIKKLDSEVRIGTYKDAYNYFKDKYDTFKIPHLKFPKSGFGLSVLKVLLWNSFAPFIIFRLKRKLRKEIENFKPDIVISDSELLIPRIAKKLNKKVIGIHNHNIKDIDKYGKRFPYQSKYVHMLINGYGKNCELVIIPDLLHKEVRENNHYIDPVVVENRKTIKNNSILIMLGGSDFGHSFIKKLIPFLKKQEEKFIIFGYKDFKEGNIESYSFNKDFISYLKGCKGLITLAGYSTLSEALYYKIPSLVFSIPNHIEQYVNANKVSNIFNADVNSENPKESISKFLRSIPEQKKKLKKLKIKNGLDEAVKLIKTI